MRSTKERVLVSDETNFFYLRRGVQRTPVGIEVEIIQCNDGIQSSMGALKGTVAFGLRNKSGVHRGQLIGFSTDREDLGLLAAEHGWQLANFD